MKLYSNFIVLEGLDGAGTTTQSRLLGDYFKAKDIPYHTTFEPTNQGIGAYIRSILQKKGKLRPETLAYLFAADRNEHIHNEEYGILAPLEAGEMVICDRYLFSSLAYQSEDCGFDFVRMLNDSFILPKNVYFVDTPLKECQRRITKRNEEKELFEEERFQEKVYNWYQKAFEFYQAKGVEIVTIDGTLTPEEIRDSIIRLGSLADFQLFQ